MKKIVLFAATLALTVGTMAQQVQTKKTTEAQKTKVVPVKPQTQVVQPAATTPATRNSRYIYFRIKEYQL
jgi:hypothetical protein